MSQNHIPWRRRKELLMNTELTEGECRYFSRLFEKLHSAEGPEDADLYKTMIVGALEMALTRRVCD